MELVILSNQILIVRCFFMCKFVLNSNERTQKLDVLN